MSMKKRAYIVIFILLVIFVALYINFSNPRIEFTNCPTDLVYEYDTIVEFDIKTGKSDIINLFVYVENNDEYYSRMYLSKEDNAALWDFPRRFETREMSWSVEIDNPFDVFTVFVEVIDESLNSGSATCVIEFG